jgi:hypothetical protein
LIFPALRSRLTVDKPLVVMVTGAAMKPARHASKTACFLNRSQRSEISFDAPGHGRSR